MFHRFAQVGCLVGAFAIWLPMGCRSSDGEGEHVKLFFAGDTMLTRGVEYATRERRDGDLRKVFEHVAPRMGEADLAVVNLEMVLSDNTTAPAKKSAPIQAPSSAVTGLTRSNIGLVALANNHALDRSTEGLVDTMRALDSIGMPYFGVETAETPQQEPHIVVLRGTRVGFLAYSIHSTQMPEYEFPRPYRGRAVRMVRDVETAADRVDVLVVMLHWGFEYAHYTIPSQRTLARELVDAGANLIVGAGPHTPQRVEHYEGALIAYSLGDFVFDKNVPFKRVRTRRGLALETVFDSSGNLVKDQLLGVEIDSDYRPHFNEGLDTESFRAWPRADGFSASRSLHEAAVFRGARRCPIWESRQPVTRKRGGYLKWIRQRFRCPEEKERPNRTVGRTSERSNSVLRDGIWAVPSPGEDVTLRWTNVHLPDSLLLRAGYPDWNADAVDGPPIEMDVTIDGQKLASVAQPRRRGWHEVTIDTRKWSGDEVDVAVILRGGTGHRDDGFVFDLVEP